MIVCHLTSVHRFDDTRIFVKECRSLAKEYDTHLIAPNAPDEVVDGVHVHGVSSAHGSRLNRMTALVRKVYQKALEVNADVYHFHDPELMLVGLRLRRKGKRVIYDVHEDVPKQIFSKHWIPKPFKKLVSASVERTEKFVCKRLSGIVTATPEIAERFKTYNPNVESVQNFPLFEEWELEAEQALEYQPPKPRAIKTSSPFQIVYVGFITKPRGIIEMINALEAVNQHYPVTLKLGGKFSHSELEREAQQLPGWKYVDFLGWLNRQQVNETMKEANLGLVLIHPEPRYMVSYPVKLFEYMSSGIPVVASNFELWEHIIYESDCGLCVDPLNIEAISSAILKIIEDTEMAKRFSKNGVQAVKNKYNWEPEYKKLHALYQKLDGQETSFAQNQ